MTRSEELFARARTVIPGGVDSPVRAFGGVGGTPVFFDRGEGAFLIDVDGIRYQSHHVEAVNPRTNRRYNP